MHSLQAENGLSTVRYNFRVCMMLLPQTMSSMFCKHSCRLTLAYVFPSPLPRHLFAEDNHFCIVLSQKFNIVSAIPVQQLAIARKKSILAKVCLDTNGASSRMLKNEYLLQQTLNCTIFRAFFSEMWCNMLLNAVHFGAKRTAF